MKLTAKDLYNSSVKKLSREERLHLAIMILNEMSANDEIDYSDSWTEEDLRDLTTFALSHSENPHEKYRSRS
jgi:predicted RNA-binding protein (virulence factor B family)